MNAEARPGYKQTEVGIIPQDWEVKRLRDISPSQTVGLVINPSSYFDEAGTIPMLVGSHVSENSISWQTANKITEKSNNQVSASRLYANDLVMVRVGEPGVTAVVPPELDGCNCASMMIIRQGRAFDSTWLCYVMNSDIGRKQVENVQYGTAQKQFNISDAVNFVYPTPPFAEQKAIASALSGVESVITSLDQLIAKKRDIQQAAMQQLLTGQRRLPGFCGEWEMTRLGSLATFMKGQGLSKSDLVVDGTRPCIHYGELFTHYSVTIQEVTSRTNNELAGFLSKENDVLMPTSDVTPRGLAKASCLSLKDVVLGGDILVIRPNPNSVNGSFLSYVIRHDEDQVLKLVTGSTVFHLYGADMKKFELMIPSIEEQNAIAAILTDMDTEIASLESRLEKTRQLKQGMMQELLTGRVRLV
ncbi:restriction endonuclease subunit S [Pseudomonas sp. MBLB4136]|uniref:restriction endonuclease subunit S n=1 Tax=Pseudomonas sp. MBLB4136 TaxID=3451558 RepID=UPI003F752782